MRPDGDGVLAWPVLVLHLFAHETHRVRAHAHKVRIQQVRHKQTCAHTTVHVYYVCIHACPGTQTGTHNKHATRTHTWVSTASRRTATP